MLDKMSYTNYNKNDSTLFTVFGLSTNVEVENKEVMYH
jgi:hypothetical protein